MQDKRQLRSLLTLLKEYGVKSYRTKDISIDLSSESLSAVELVDPGLPAFDPDEESDPDTFLERMHEANQPRKTR